MFLKTRSLEIDRHRVHLREPIKRLGEFSVPVCLHRDVTIEVRITITPCTDQEACLEQLEFDRYLNQIVDSHLQMQQSEGEINRLKDETRRALAELRLA
jgi:hypothetical protein